MIREGTIRLPFTYAAGKSGSAFYRALQERQCILGSRCTECQRVLAPARSFCPTCGDATLEDVDISSTGVLLAWTERPGKGLLGLIRLDSADTAIVHRILGSSDSLSSGMPVRARFDTATAENPHEALLGFEVGDERS
ncbi:MAG: hypothetical protein GY783_00445 [Gammaproteobacteria bacterium]|nr:hypothetical protein [Gammaproteobacteria bacterium]